MTIKNSRTIQFLPEVFRTPTNDQFLSASLDLLTTQPEFNKIEGFVGQKYGYAVEGKDRYAVEPTATRSHYQLSPAVVFLKENTQQARDFIDYPNIVAALQQQNAPVNDPNKLFASDFYSWDSFCDLDKIVNYSQYYWLPLGPDSVSVSSATTIDISTIVGQVTYTSENGVEFINGLKVKFTSATLPVQYQDVEYYVEGVGSKIVLIPVTDMLVVEKSGGGIYDPWSGTPWDSVGWDINLYVAVNLDYITINRNSRDRNAWSRGNRWFSQSVIDATLAYNGQVTTIASNTMTRARRPIIEFYGDLSLWNSGTVGAGFVDFVDNTTQDPLSTIQGSNQCVLNSGHTNTVTAQAGTTVIFTAALDPLVRKTVYKIDLVSAGAGATQVVTLTAVPGKVINDGSQVAVSIGPGDTSGTTQRWVAATATWVQCQVKIEPNQRPLFDIFNENGISLGNNSFYANTTFAGTTLFRYAPAEGVNDAVLGFPISYSSVSNLGDINFEVTLNSDTFSYTQQNTTLTKNISIGVVHYMDTATTYIERNGWVKAAGSSFQHQVFKFIADSETLAPQYTCDIIPTANSVWTTTQVFVNGNFISTTEYSVIVDTVENTTTILLNSTPVTGSSIDVLIISDQVSAVAYYSIPANLQNNPFNTNITTVTVGDIRGHYKTIFQNKPGITGTEFGINNYNNLGELINYGTSIVQNSASLVLPSVFLRNPGYDIIQALSYNSDEYTDYKNTVIDIAYREDYSVYQSPAQILDSIIYKITAAKSEDESFFWSDMIFSGSARKVTDYNFGADVAFAVCPLSKVYDYSSANYSGVAVYLKRTVANRTIYRQLTRGVDYTVDSLAPSLRVDYAILNGDVITVKEYDQTWGSYVPATPTSLGMYPATIPKITADVSATRDNMFIVGHDGSWTRLYGEYLPLDSADLTRGYYLTDFRDIALFEFEQRVYNNIKVSGTIPLIAADIMPGQFRTTEYTRDQIMPAYSEHFLSWVGKNRLDYRTQVYSASNQFSFNYNKSSNKVDGEVIASGAWRGIYLWFYDTVDPANKPWEMLGFTDEPSWWQTRYGAAPYTNGNTFMWSDIAEGYIWNNGQGYVDSRYVRTGLLSVLPVDSSGNLLSPLSSVVASYSSTTFNRSWVAGDGGPVEASYRKSSTWPFDLVKLLATFKPAKFYNLFADRDNYKYDSAMSQYLSNTGGHLQINELEVYGAGVSKNSYINWVVDYLNQWGKDGATTISTTLKSLDVRLTYRLAGFSDKQYLKFLIERSTPSSNTPRLLIPDDSYQVMLYNNVPEDTINYSSVIVQKTKRGWTVWGNSATRPYFDIAVALDGPIERITVDSVSVRLSTVYKAGSSMLVAYGTEFYSLDGVAEFLRNYGRRLSDLGVVSTSIVNGVSLDWTTMIKEFVNWAQQGWEVGSTVSFNPNASSLTVEREGLVVQPLTLRQQNFALNQNLVPLTEQNSVVQRLNQSFEIKVLSEGDTVAYTNLHLNSIEHAVIFDNTTIFNDVIYQLSTGLRQNRIVVTGNKTASWTGAVDTNGFILNEGDIEDWATGVKYVAGQIVYQKTGYWSANELVEPAETFDYTKWTAIDYERIKKGLLPNPSTMSYEATKFYDINVANLERDKDLLAFGLIGFRPRDYMVDAEITDISQVNIYNTMLKTKGTVLSAESFKGANLIQGQIDYDVRENWAIKNGDFGAVLNSNFVEFMLDGGSLVGNPAMIGFTDADSTVSDVQQKVDIADMINYARAPYSARFLPAASNNRISARSLPTAGYVNLDDVDLWAYTYDDLNLDASTLKKLYTSSTIWIANHGGSWAVFTPVTIGTTASRIVNNLNGTIDIVFNDQHGLVADDNFAITGFDAIIDGFFTVKTVVALNRVTVSKTVDKSTTTLDSTGIALKMVSRRFAVAGDSTTITGREFEKRLSWVDQGSNGSWQVLGTAPVYSNTTIERAADIGATVAYSTELGVLTTDGAGMLYQNGLLQTIAIGTQIVANDNMVYGVNGAMINVVSYNGTTFKVQQTIASTATALAVSDDGMWLYASDVAAATVRVYMLQAGVYTLADQYSGPASQGWGASITTTRDGRKLIVGAADATVAGVTRAGKVYIYARSRETFISDGVQISFTIANSASRAIVKVNSAAVTATVSGTTVTLTAVPVAGSTVSIDYGHLELQQTVVGAGARTGTLFGHSVATRQYGAEIFVGSPYEFDTATQVEGAVFRLSNAGQRGGSVTATVAGTASGTIFIDGFRIDFNGSASDIASQINAQEPTNVTATVSGTTITISTVRGTVDTLDDIIDIVGLTEADLTALGITSYTVTQVIANADNDTDSQFGWTVAVNRESEARDSLLIAAPRANARAATTFDFIDDLDVYDDTRFDNGATTFVDTFKNTGVVYEYDYLAASEWSLTTPGAYVFGQYCVYTTVTEQSTNSRWGNSLAFNDGAIVVGSSTWFNDSTGIVAKFTAIDQTSSWYVASAPIAQVDVNRLKNIAIYDTHTNTDVDHLDYINPVQGKHLSAVETNVDFIGQTNPASYEAGLVWGSAQVGVTWLDTTDLRMLDTTGPDKVYNSQRWGQAFPGARATIYTWIASKTEPVTYAGSGFPVSFDLYTTGTIVNNSTETVSTEYYFWVKGYGEIPEGKTLSPIVVEEYIVNPTSSGIAFLAGITLDTVALYNCQSSTVQSSVALHLGYSVGNNDDRAHQDWSLIQDGTAGQFLTGVPKTIGDEPTGLYLKYLNSFMGYDLSGQPVPDPALPALMKSGIQFRPRQTMFLDRQSALKNYIDYANAILIKEPITETRGTYFLNEIGAEYDVSDYWVRVDWWATGYSANTKVIIEVETYTDLLTIGQRQLYTGTDGLFLSLEPGLVVRVAKNGQGYAETYAWYAATGWQRIGLASGTYQILSTLYTIGESYYDAGWNNLPWNNEAWDRNARSRIPSREIYSIVRWLTEQVYVNDLAIENNRSLMLMFSVIQSQSQQQNNYLTWLNKTSLIDVTHLIRPLAPYKKYQRDNQELVRGYINEVKPYHVYIKEFGLKYTKLDMFNGQLTDFDLPAQYNTIESKFSTPRLVYGSTTNTDEYTVDSTIWSEQEYTNWFSNWGLSLSNAEDESVPVTRLVTLNVEAVLAVDVAIGDPRITLVDSKSFPISGMININGHLVEYTDVNYYTNRLTLAQTSRWAHTAGVLVTAIVTAITSSTQTLTLKNTSGLPDSGTIIIDSEMIAYTGNDKANDILTGITRGVNGTVATVHYDNAVVSLVTQTITVLNGGRGYTSVPAVTVTIDTSKYPTPRQTATLTAVMSGNKVSSITVVNAGAGYAVMPTITVAPSSITDTWAATDVDTGLNQITITGHKFVTGDSVVFTGSTAVNFGLKDGAYYYVGVIDANTIAIYSESRDAELCYTNSFRRDTKRIALNVQSAGTLTVGARVEIYTSGRPVREMSIGIKFDRTSYRYHADDQNAIYRIQNYYKPTVNMPGFDLDDYDQLMTGTRLPVPTVIDPAFDYGKTLVFASADIDTALDEITVNLMTGYPAIVYDTALLTDRVYQVVFMVTTGAYNVNFGLTSGNTYYIRALTTGIAARVAVYATENDALISANRIALTTALTTGQFVVTGDNAGFNAGYDSILVNDNTAVSTVYDISGGTFDQNYGPEELVPGVFTGTVDITVTSKPGSSWLSTTPAVTATGAVTMAHTGFNMSRHTLTPVGGVISFKDLVANPVSFALYANGKLYDTLALDGSERHVAPDYYTIDWINQTITLNDGPLITNGSLLNTPIDIVMYEWGNGNQIVRGNSFSTPVRNNSILLDVTYADLLSALPDVATNYELTWSVVVDGVTLKYGTDYTVEPLRPLDVNDPFNPAQIVFTSTYDPTVNYITWVATADQQAENGAVTLAATGVSIPRTEWSSGYAGTGITLPLANFTGDTNIENMIVEVNGQRIVGAAPVDITYTALAGVQSYAAPVYGMASFDITKLEVTVNGVVVPPSNTAWQTNYDPLAQFPSRFDAEFDLLFGYFDSGTPFDNWTALDVVFVPGTINPGDVIKISYDRDGSPNPVYVVTPDASGIGGSLVVNFPLTSTDIVSVTTFDRTTDQSLVTQILTDRTVSLITSVLEDGINPVRITTRLPHNLEIGDQITINGSAAPDLDGNKYYVNTIDPFTFELYSDPNILVPLVMTNTSSMLPANSSFVQVIDVSQVLPLLPKNPFLINQPTTLTDVNRLWVSHVVGTGTDIRGYITPEKLMLDNNTLIILEEVEPSHTIAITSTVATASPSETKLRITSTSARTMSREFTNLPITTGIISNVVGATAVNYSTLLNLATDDIVRIRVTSGGVEITDYKVQSIANAITPSTALVFNTLTAPATVSVSLEVRQASRVYRENQFTRTYLTATTTTNFASPLTDTLVVADPYRVVAVSTVNGITVISGIVDGVPANYCDVSVSDVAALTSITSTVTDFTVTPITKTLARLVFATTAPGTVLNFTVAIGNTILVNGELIVFRKIDMLTGAITGLSRGTNGTIVNTVLPQWSTVQSVLPENLLATAYNAIDWYELFTGIDRNFPTLTMPLQTVSTVPADFLNQAVR